MDCRKVILGRKSIRKFTERVISDADLKEILRAGMSGPCCVNARDWQFLVVRNKEMLGKMADANGNMARPLKSADVGILVCGDKTRAFQGAPDYWIIDGSIAAQNMILAAVDLGIGSVWLGTYPQMNRVEAQRKLFKLPEEIVPHSVIAFGYPASSSWLYEENRDCYEESQVHFEQW